MTARSIRRAQERKAKKLARREEARLPQIPASPSPISEAQLIANRKNAQLSTGPKSNDGQAKSSLNAVKTGLTGATVLLPSDDVAAYERHIGGSFAAWKPESDREKVLVQSIADTEWRLLRIPSLESGIYALGYLEFANSVDEQDTRLHSGLIEVKTLLKYERQLRNLHLQEGRLRRQREKDMAELRALQLERQRKEAEDLEKVGQALSPGTSNTARPAENGFEFSTGYLDLPPSPVSSCESSSAPAIPPQARAA